MKQVSWQTVRGIRRRRLGAALRAGILALAATFALCVSGFAPMLLELADSTRGAEQVDGDDCSGCRAHMGAASAPLVVI